MNRKSKFGPFLVAGLISLVLIDIVVFKPDLIDELTCETRWETQIALSCFIIALCGLIFANLLWASNASCGEALPIGEVAVGTVFNLIGAGNDHGSVDYHVLVRLANPAQGTIFAIPVDKKVHALILNQARVPKTCKTVIVIRNYQGQNVLIEYPLPDTAVDLQVAIHATSVGT